MTISVPHHTTGTCFGLPYQDHNYGAPPPPTPPSCSPHLSPIHVSTIVETETVSIVTSETTQDAQETSVTRCVCGYKHDDEYMICCDHCLVWQHVDCMGLDRNKIPDTYLCEECEPRKVDRHKAKLLQAKKKVVLPEKLIFTETSDDSDEDRGNKSSDTLKSKIRKTSARRKHDDDKDVKVELASPRKGKSHAKHGKESPDIKRPKFRRRAKNRSESTYVTDEEAQDAWPRRRSEGSLDNRYSEEINSLADALRNQNEEQKLGKQLQDQLCKVADCGSLGKKLVAVSNLMKNQIIIEFKGHFTSASLFHEKHPVYKQKLFPSVLFYKLRSNEELCVDATNYKCDAKHVRRSCRPNAEVHHFVVNGSLNLYILSIKEIHKDEEITIPFDIKYEEGSEDVMCACNMDNCYYAVPKKPVITESSEKKLRKSRKGHVSTDDDSNPSVAPSPVKLNKNAPTTRLSLQSQKNAMLAASLIPEPSDIKIPIEDTDSEEQSKEHKKKLTREERKIDAIMRAFDQMEKAAKRRQQALDRMAHHKPSKSEESPEKPEMGSVVPKEEEKISNIVTPNLSMESISAEEEQKPVANASQTPKPKKGKRRRGSGTRRRTRTNSGGSDVFTSEDASLCEPLVQTLTSPSLEPPEPVTSPLSLPEAAVPQTPPPQMITAIPSQTVTSPVFLKTKRFLHHEWLQEKVESMPTTNGSLSIQMDTSSSVITTTPSTCYVRCTKDSPTAGGISAAHLRRSSLIGQYKQPSGQGSAKKRWLRQAMYDYEPMEAESVGVDVVNGSMSPLHTPCFSPQSQAEGGSPGVCPLDDVITPLKKRRLMRRSVESLSSPKSPTAESTGGTSSGLSPDNSSCEPMTEALVDVPCSADSPKILELENVTIKCIPSGNGLGKHLLKSLREKWIMNDNKTKANNATLESDIEKSPKNDSPSEPIKAEISDANILKPMNHTISDPTEDDFVMKETVSLTEQAPELVLSTENRSQPNVTENFAKDSSIIDDESHAVANVDDTKTDVTTDSKSSQSQNITAPLCQESYSLPLAQDHKAPDISHAQETFSSTAQIPSIDHQLTAKDKKAIVAPSSDDDPSTVSPQKNLSADDMSERVPETLCRLNLNSSEAQTTPVNTSEKMNSVAMSSLHAQTDISKKCSPENSGSLVNRINTCSDSVSPCVVTQENQESEAMVLSSVTVPSIEKETDPSLNLPNVQPSEDKGSSQNTKVVGVPATQKRKVSLSEYRQRKRDNPTSNQVNNNNKQKSNNCILKPVDMTENMFKDEIKLAALPLFENPQKPLNSEKSKITGEKSKKIVPKQNNEKGDLYKKHHEPIPKARENLTSRLKREFGFEEDTEDKKKEGLRQRKPIIHPKIPQDISPIMSLCAPCPMVPPPPSVVLMNSNNVPPPPPVGLPFSYPPAQPSPYLIPPPPPHPIASSQYLATAQPLLHHPSSVAIQSNCSYGAALRAPPPPPPPSVAAAAYMQVNSQTMGAQHMPQLALPTAYPHPPFQSTGYK